MKKMSNQSDETTLVCGLVARNLVPDIVPIRRPPVGRLPEAQVRWALLADHIDRLSSDQETFTFMERTQLGLLAVILRTGPRLAARLGTKQPRGITDLLKNYLKGQL